MICTGRVMDKTVDGIVRTLSKTTYQNLINVIDQEHVQPPTTSTAGTELTTLPVAGIHY